MAEKHCLVPSCLLQSPLFGSTLGRAVVHLLFPRHRVDAPHETRVRLATVLFHFCLPILRDFLSLIALVSALFLSLVAALSLDSIACTRALLSRERAAVFRFRWEKKRKSPEGASGRPGSRALETQRTAMKIKVSFYLRLPLDTQLAFYPLRQEIISRNATNILFRFPCCGSVSQGNSHFPSFIAFRLIN